MRWIRVAVATLTLLASTMAIGPAVSAAIDWRPEVIIARSDAGPIVADASYRGGLTAIAWRAASDADGSLRLAMNGQAGVGAFIQRMVAQRVDGVAVSACGKDVVVAYRQRLVDGSRRLRLALVAAGGGPIERVTIRRSIRTRGALDVACGSRRATVVWTERVGTAWHAFARHVRLDGSGRTRPQDLGLAARGGVAAAGSDDLAYVAWSDPDGIRLARYTIGAPPEDAVEGGRARMVALYGRGPVLAAGGARLLLGDSALSDVELRLSEDGGRTFAKGTGFGPDPGEASVLSLGIRGRRIVATLEYTYGSTDPSFYRMASRDHGDTWSLVRIGGNRRMPIDGFLASGTGTKLAETHIGDEAGRLAWALVFRRQR
jgi:hypothetical protein